MLKNKRIRIKAILAIFLIIALVLLFHNSKDGKTFEVIYGEVTDALELNCILVRDESVQYSPISGTVTVLANEGERQKIGTLIAEINGLGSNRKVFSPQSGLVSFSIDGWEDILKPDHLRSFTKDFFTRVKAQSKTIRSGSEVKAGQPLFRIVDNFTLFLLVEIPRGEFYFRLNKDLHIRFPRLDDKRYEAEVLFLNEDEGIGVLEVKSFVAEFLSLRKQPLTIVKGIYSGLIVPVSALDIEKGVAGVWVAERGAPSFKIVKVIGQDDSFAVIEGLRVGDEIYKTPPKGF